MLRVTTSTTAQHLVLADQHLAAGRLPAVEELCRRVLQTEPNHPDALRMLALVAFYTGHAKEAETLLARALSLAPNDFKSWTALGGVYLTLGNIDGMTDSFRKAISLEPRHPQALCNLAYALNLTGELDESIQLYRRALDLRPDWQGAHSSLLNALYFHPAYDAKAIYDQHARWNSTVAQPLTDRAAPHPNDPAPDRRLRVGYLSPNLRRHAVGRFMAPVFAHHDHQAFEIFAYADLAGADDVTQQFRTRTDTWRPIHGLPDDQVAALIRKDQIDILIDLTMHLVDNRMLVFARKPAPVQITYLAYCGTTGLRAMDYRISDPLLDPEGGPDEALYSEKTLRLPCYWCYTSTGHSPPSDTPPSATNGWITFGCLNNFAKISPQAIDTWAAILRGVPGSRLLLHSPPGRHRERPLAAFEAWGIARQRISFVPHVTREEYLATYHRIDIALDPFPHAGGTTTCDALYSGVPVVTLRGKTAVGRGGVTILSHLQLPQLIAETPEEYAAKAIAWAGDLPRLAELRKTLRGTMEHSPLMDQSGFTRSLEALYRDAWRDWCATRGR